MITPGRYTFVIVGLWMMASSVCQAAGPRVPQLDGVFYYKPAASVFGSEAAWINPAALGRYDASSYQLMADIATDRTFKSWGMVVARERLALAYRSVEIPDDDDVSEYLFAGGFSLSGKANLGGSYRYLREGPGSLNNRHFWNLALSGNGRGPFAWAAVFSNLNRGRVGSERSRIEQRYSLSYRPFGPVATLSADMLLPTGVKFSDADFIYHLEATPYSGLYLEGFVDSEGNFQAGFRVNLVNYFVGLQSFFSDDRDHLRTTTFAGATNLRQPSVIRNLRSRRLSLGISGGVAENPARPVFGPRRGSFVELMMNLYRAAEDPSIAELVINLRGLALGFGQAQELREALTWFKQSGKTVICHLSHPNNLGYYVASAADSILIPPVSQLNLVGLRAELTFYTGTMDKLGIKADIMRIGDYKTAPERFTETSSTEANREQVNRLLDDLYDQFVSAIAEGRGLSPDSVRTIIDNGPYTSREALKYHLVEGLSYRDVVSEDFLSPMPTISFRRYMADTLLNDGWPERPMLALVVADGEISFDDDAGPLGNRADVSPSLMERAFAGASENPRVAGVVFRIDSPGGLALAAEEIYRDAQRLAEHKPLVVSMANMAASGGYYIAMPSARLFASPATITGSIGLYGGKVDLSGLYIKIDLHKELYLRGKYAGMLTMMRPFTPEEREKYYSHITAFYEHFVTLVADNRRLSTDSVNALSQGRVWTGRQAVDNGLIDEFGGLNRSLEYTAERLGLDDYRVVVYPRKRPLFLLPAESVLRKIGQFFSGGGQVPDLLRTETDLPSDGQLLTRLPYDITIE